MKVELLKRSLAANIATSGWSKKNVALRQVADQVPQFAAGMNVQ